MRTIDRIMEILAGYPQGLSTPDITRLIYPDAKDYEMNGRRTVVYAKLRNLERYGMVHTVTTGSKQAGSVWAVRE